MAVGLVRPIERLSASTRYEIYSETITAFRRYRTVFIRQNRKNNKPVVESGRHTPSSKTSNVQR